VAVLERFPLLRRAIANQYQAILVAGAVGFSLIFANPLPLLLLAGLELMTMPLWLERLKRRMEIERKASQRQFETISAEQRYAELPYPSKQRFDRLRQLCAQIQENYRGLSPASQGMLADQTGKFDAILGTCLRRLWLLQKYDELGRTFNAKALQEEIGRIQLALKSAQLDGRVREAWEQNLAIKQKLLASAEQNRSSQQALAAELDSLETLLQLLLQKSIAATDAGSFALEIDEVMSQVEADAQSVAELERMLGALPELMERAPLGDRLGLPQPQQPPGERGRQGGTTRRG
jgi:hypothetical protein